MEIGRTTGAVVSRVIFSALSAVVFMNAAFAVQASDDNEGLAEIVVTAEKRSENLQDVPLAITALDAAQLEISGIHDIRDLAQTVPGVLMLRDGVWSKLYIRGVGSNTVSVGSDPSVAEYIDGVYVARPSAVLQQFSDIERIEILKGPQGVLYGRNATGGAISIFTKRPGDELEADGDLIAGNYSTVRVRAGVGGPLSDWARVRFSGIYTDNPGYQSNLFAPGRRQNGDIAKGARLTVDLSRSDTFQASLTLSYVQDLIKIIGDRIFGQGFATLVPPFSNAYDVDIDNCQCAKTEQAGATAMLSWLLGDLTLKSISGFTRDTLTLDNDVDRTQFDIVNLPENEQSRTLSQELQLSPQDGGMFPWVAGLYYFNEYAHQNYNFESNGPPLGVFTDPVKARDETNSYAGFAQGSFHFAKQWSLTGGGRFTDEEKHFTRFESLIIPGIGTLPNSQDLTAKFDAFTPTLGVEYRPHDDLMVYVSATRGFKSGGFNAIGSAGSAFKPEYIWDYALGLKSTLFENRLRLNLEGYYYDYSNLQVSQVTTQGTTTITNAASARIKGFDADIALAPAKGLDLEVDAGYLDATYKDFQADPTHDVAGNQLPNAPKLSASASATYVHPTSNAGSMIGRIELVHKSSLFFEPFNVPALEQKPYSLLNARIAYRTPDSRLEFALFGNNLTNHYYIVNGVDNNGFIGYIVTPGTPRTYGVQFSYSSKPKS